MRKGYLLIFTLFIIISITNCGLEKSASLNFSVLVAGADRSRAADSNLATEITSLKYSLQNLAIYQNMTTNGSGYSNTEGAVTFYKGTATYDYNTFDAEAAKLTDEGYIDLMDTASLNSLVKSISITSSQTGDYQFTGADWYQPAKITASVLLQDGTTTIYTKDGTTANSVTTTSADMSAGPAQEAIVQFNNGGTWFKFLKPLTITQADIENETAFNVVMVFNPDSFIAAWDSNGSSAGNSIVDNAGHGIVLPFLDLVPVAYRAGDNVIRETYTFTVVNGIDNNFDVRFEVYTVGSDTTSVYAATLRHIVNASATIPGGASKIFFVDNTSAGDLVFQDWSLAPILDNFERLSTVGTTGTATYYPGYNNPITVTYTLTDSSIVL